MEERVTDGAVQDSPIQIPLSRMTSIPTTIQVLSVEALVGDRSIVEEVIFESGSLVHKISARTFKAFPSLKSIVIAASGEVIGEECFQRCLGLLSLTFEAGCGLRRLERLAVAWCTSLPSICIPASVEFIGEHCFFDCKRMLRVTFESGSQLSTMGSGPFYHCTMLGPSIELPSSLKVVSGYCFTNCESLSVITFAPNPSVRAIHGASFLSCGLRSFCIPDSVVVVDWSCFECCFQLTDITFASPSAVETIDLFDPGTVPALQFPDSLISLTVDRGNRQHFVGTFGRNSRLQDLRALLLYPAVLASIAFLHLSEPALKRIREANEWSDQ
jgi:hypothetical protein